MIQLACGCFQLYESGSPFFLLISSLLKFLLPFPFVFLGGLSVNNFELLICRANAQQPKLRNDSYSHFC